MRNSIKNVIQNCEICQKYSDVASRQQNSNIISCAVPFEHIAIDIIGPFSISTSKNRFIVAITDVASRYGITKAIPDKSSATVAKFLFENVLCVHGMPKILQSDQGTEFVNLVIQYICSLIRTKVKYSSPFHPQGNGVIESFNGTLLAKLSRLVASDSLNWDLYLPIATMSYQLCYHSSIGMSPFRAVFGRDPAIPAIANSEKDTIKCAWDALNLIYPYLDLLHQNRILQETQLLTPYPSYEIGQQVLVKAETPLKLAPKWLGPFQILQVGSKNCYFYCDQNGSRKQAHASRLKPFLAGGNDTQSRLS